MPIRRVTCDYIEIVDMPGVTVDGVQRPVIHVQRSVVAQLAAELYFLGYGNLIKVSDSHVVTEWNTDAEFF